MPARAYAVPSAALAGLARGAAAPCRARRAIAAAAVAVALAAAGHWAASGVLPGALPLIACLAGIAWLAQRAAWREWSASEIVLLLVAAGGACHLVFALAGAVPAGSSPAQSILLAAPEGSALAASSLALLAAHLAASVAAALALRRGERALWAVARGSALLRARLAGVLRRPHAFAPGFAEQRFHPVRAVAVARHRRLLCASSRRGPPLCGVAL